MPAPLSCPLMSPISSKKMYADRVCKGCKIKVMNRTKIVFQITSSVLGFLEIKSASSKQALISAFCCVQVEMEVTDCLF
jgi:hypothetical protein